VGKGIRNECRSPVISALGHKTETKIQNVHLEIVEVIFFTWIF
jgi:hypothetical protein